MDTNEVLQIDDIYNMSDEEFANCWNTQTCKDALDVMHGKVGL